MRSAICSALVVLWGCTTGGAPPSPSPSDTGKPVVTPANDKTGKSESTSVLAPDELGRQPKTRQGAPTPPAPTLWLEPGDLLTSTGQTPIRALLENAGRPVPPELLSAVAAQLELRDYPGLNVIQSTFTVYNPPELVPTKDNPEKGATVSTPLAPETRAYVELKPKSALSESWYVLSLKTVPKGIQLAPWSAPNPPIGVYAARFHTGSQPVISRVLFCDKGGAKTRAIFEFSENVAPGTVGFDAAIRIQQQGNFCKYASSGPMPNASAKWIDQDCVGVSTASPLHVQLNRGLQSGLKVPVRTFKGDETLDVDIDPTALTKEGGDGCVAWRP